MAVDRFHLRATWNICVFILWVIKINPLCSFKTWMNWPNGMQRAGGRESWRERKRVASWIHLMFSSDTRKCVPRILHSVHSIASYCAVVHHVLLRSAAATTTAVSVSSFNWLAMSNTCEISNANDGRNLAYRMSRARVRPFQINTKISLFCCQ